MTISTSSLLCQFLIMIYVTILCLISFPLFTIFQDHMIHFHVFKYRIYACGVYICVCVYIYIHTPYIWGFPDSSVGKESACNAGDPCSIPGSRRSAWEGIGNPLQYSWATLVAQLVKNLPAMQETWVGSLGWEDPLEKGKATYLSILAWRIPWTV